MQRGMVTYLNPKGFALVQDGEGNDFLFFRGDHSFLMAEGSTWTKEKISSSTYGYKQDKGELHLQNGSQIVFEAEVDSRGRYVVVSWEFAKAFEYLREKANLPACEYSSFQPKPQTGIHYLATGSDSVPTSPKQVSSWRVTILLAIIDGKEIKDVPVTYTECCPYFANVNDGWLAKMRHHGGYLDLYDALQTEGSTILFESNFSMVTYQVIEGQLEEVSAETKTIWGPGRPRLAWIPKGGDAYSTGIRRPIEWFGPLPTGFKNYGNIRKVWIKSPTMASLIVPNQDFLHPYRSTAEYISEAKAKEYAETIREEGIKIEFNDNGRIMKVGAAGRLYDRHPYGRFTMNVFTSNGLEDGKVEVRENALPTIFLGRKISYAFKDIGQGAGTIYVPLRDVKFIGYE